MNTAITSKEKILKAGRELIRRQGWSAVSIRSLAVACGISIGAVYNYFDSKAELVGATVESVWHEIFHRAEDADEFRNTEEYVAWMYERMTYGGAQYPGFFTLHSTLFVREDKLDGRRRMQQTRRHLLDDLCSVMKKDEKIRQDVFTDWFTAEQFADVLFSVMLSALLRQDYNPSVALELVRRALY